MAKITIIMQERKQATIRFWRFPCRCQQCGYRWWSRWRVPRETRQSIDVPALPARCPQCRHREWRSMTTGPIRKGWVTRSVSR